jgi:DegV family protein with EDD domain
MGSVAIVTDTTHYLPREMVSKLGLHEVSLYVNWDNRQEREADLDDLEGFYRQLRSSDGLPTTSQPSIGDFLSVYRPLVEAGNQILSIHLASGISGTYQAALQAKATLDEEGLSDDQITVMDSQMACGALGFVLMAAGQGSDLPQALENAKAARDQMRMWFAVDTLEFLRRGGRIGAAQAWLGSTLKIKPILSIHSEITPVERVRTQKKAMERLTEYMHSRYNDGADAWAVQHTQAPDQASELVEQGQEIFGCEPQFVSEIGPVIGAHIGPGLIGVGALPKSLVATR